MNELAAGDVIAGKFRLERLVGRGGMGSVWAARHVQLGMPVALKFIETEEGADVVDARARFEREARAAGQLRSPHVVQILDHGIDGDRPYIAMELLEGEDLGERLRRDGRVGVAAMAKILTQSAKALRRAHDAGIIHRDLKPGNVFLARFDDDEVVKILDFGVAKIQRAGSLDGHQGTQTGIIFGSPSYMSPEQVRGVRAIDHRSDLWSLAVIAFRGVTGVKPFTAASIGEMVIKLCIDPIPVATHLAPDLPPEIDGFFARAFARDPDQRFASAPEMAAAFELVAAVAGWVPAPPASLPTRSPFAPTPPSGALPSSPTASFPSIGPGSGPRVVFAPGTLTPPPGMAGELRVAPAPAPPFELELELELAFAAAQVAPIPPVWGALPPTAGAIEVPLAPPAPPVLDLERRPARAALDRKVVIRAGLGGAAFGLVLVGLFVFVLTRHGASAAGSVTASALSSSTAVAAPPPEPALPVPPPAVTAASPSAMAPPEPVPSASAEPAASAEAEPEPSATPPAHPTRFKPGKKRRPNFGY